MLSLSKKRLIPAIIVIVSMLLLIPLVMGLVLTDRNEDSSEDAATFLGLGSFLQSAETTPGANEGQDVEGPGNGDSGNDESVQSPEGGDGESDRQPSQGSGMPGTGAGEGSEGAGDFDFAETAAAQVFSTVQALVGIQPLAAGTSSDLTDFLDRVIMTDSGGNVIFDSSAPSAPPADTYIGQTYKFSMTFSEKSQLQMEYAPPLASFPAPAPSPPPAGTLSFQLPADLNIQNAIAATPLYGDGPTYAIIGWYTIDLNGLVQVWFNNVDMQGNPTPNDINFIDYYANVTLDLEVFAELVGGADGNLGFGDIVVEIVPPVAPDPTLNMVKSSRYNPVTQTVYYMITISASGGSVTNITLDDTPTVGSGTPISEDKTTTYPNGAAFSEMTYEVSRAVGIGIGPDPLAVSWGPGPGPVYDGASFSYDFAGLVLNEGDLITIRYQVNLPRLIENNNNTILAGNSNQPLAGQNTTSYNFTLNNTATINGEDASDNSPLVPVTDGTVDHVRREVTLQKGGNWVQLEDRIQWSITVGDGISMPLNNGILTDTHGAGILLPADSSILISFYGAPTGSPATAQTSPFWSGNASDPSLVGFYTRVGDSGFTLQIPSTLVQAVYKVEVTYSTPLDPGDIPQSGEAAIIYTNDVNFQLPDGSPGPGTTGKVPIYADSLVASKTTSGICGTPGTGYYVTYTANVEVPGGLEGQPIYIYDTLGYFGSGAAVPNLPTSITVTVDDGVSQIVPPHGNALSYSANSWRLFFGDDAAASPSAVPAGNGAWPYSDPVTLTVEYTVTIDSATLAKLQGTKGSHLQNALFVINSADVPNTAQYGNSVGSASAWDSWPIFKSYSATANPALFNYKVDIVGDFSSKSDPLLPNTKSPVFGDTFDTRLEYVPGSFYIVNTSTNPRLYYAPVGDVAFGAGGFTAPLAGVWQVRSGSLTAAATLAPSDWFAQSQNFEAHYQLRLTEPALAAGIPQTAMNNVANILVNENECNFQSSATVNYNPQKLDKSMAPHAGQAGSDRIDVEIIINPDGSVVFNDGISSPPVDIIAQDFLNNLVIFTDTVQFWTQGMTSSGWDGVWVEVSAPISFNDYTRWSVNLVTPPPTGFDGEVDFVVPNAQPVKVTYQARVTLAPGDTGTIANEIHIFDDNSGDSKSGYVVGGAGIGVGAGMQPLRVFKSNQLGENLPGALFELYVTDVSAGYIPPGGMATAKTLTGTGGKDMNFALVPAGATNSVTTDASGMAYFPEYRWLTSSYEFLYLLVEVEAPAGYTAPNFYSFFTLSSQFSQADIAAINTLIAPLARPFELNQISDFINVANIPAELQPGSLRIIKDFDGLTNAQVLQYLRNFEIVFTDFYLQEYRFSVYAALNPFGMILTDIPEGLFTIDENNAEVPGFSLETSPTMPARGVFMPDSLGEITFTIHNSYTPEIPRVPIPPPEPDTPVTPHPPEEPGDDSRNPLGGPRTGDIHRASTILALLLAAGITALGSTVGLVRERRARMRKMRG